MFKKAGGHGVVRRERVRIPMSSVHVVEETPASVVLSSVFAYLDPPDLGSCLLVSKGWNKVITEKILADPDRFQTLSLIHI